MSEVRLRLARDDELSLLDEVERQAGRRFAGVEGLASLAEDRTPIEELIDAHRHGHVWVAVAAESAGDRIVGFAYAALIGGNFHLEELSVVPEHGRRGIGKALVLEVIRRAVDEGYPAVTLTTFRHVPWNAPFYAKLGFRIVAPAEQASELAAAFRDEARRGLPIALRVVMRLDVADPEV